VRASFSRAFWGWRTTLPGVPAGTRNATASARAAAPANAQRQPKVRAMVGTARPASRVAAGMADCLTPNDSPCRPAGTSRASDRFVAGCEAAFASPPRTRHATSPAQEAARRATPRSEAALPSAANRMPRWAPILSTKRPITAEASAEETKNAATESPRAAAPEPSSPRTCTASPPVRKAGSTVAVTTATASKTGWRFEASCSGRAPSPAVTRGMRAIIARVLAPSTLLFPGKYRGRGG